MSRRLLFERKHQPLLPYSLFLQRMVRCALISMVLMVSTISLGAMGYHWIEKQSWIDATLNSVLVMMGLGLVNALGTSGGKLFTVFFSLLSPLVFYAVLALLFTPLLHRFLHDFHLDK